MKGVLGLVVLLAAALPATAQGSPRAMNVDGARAAHGASSLPRTVAGGDVTVTPAEGLASITQTVVVHVVRGGAVDIELPARFSDHAANGRPYVKGTPSSAVADAGADLVLDVSGLPAGTYRLPLRREGRSIGTATFRLYTPQREGEEGDAGAGGPFGRLGRIPIDSSNSADEETETFVAVDPSDSSRIITSANQLDGGGLTLGGVSVTSDGGSTWIHPSFPTTFDVPLGADETEIPGGDPILAASDSGDLWAGGLSRCDPHTPTSKSHIFVHRIPAGTNGFVAGPNVALPTLRSGPTCATDPAYVQDKPQMTIDNWPTSPTYGRIYVTWDEPDVAGSDVVVSYCDTKLGPTTPDNCDSAGKWKGPYKVSDLSGGGSYISSDPAVGPDGTVYVAWWDFSGANAIAIDRCIPAATAARPCATWGTDQVLASLSEHFGQLVPFACPTLAQPGGRAAPVPSLAVDSAGRIFAAWGDLGTTGTQRCGFEADGAMTRPDANQDAFNAYVASGSFADLTAATGSASGSRGTNVFGEPGDHWFPWVGGDPDTGAAAVALYSTRGDATRTTANYYVRAVVPDATSTTRVQYGDVTRVSDVASDYSDQACRQFGNDYGDYAGLAASSALVFPAWDRRLRGAAGEVYIGPFGPHPTTFESPQDNPPLPPVSAEYLPQCSPPAPPPAPATTTATTPTPTPPVDRTPPRLRITYGTRADRKGRYKLTVWATREPARGSALLRLAHGRKRKLASGLIATSGTKSVKLVLRLKHRDVRLLERRHKLRVRLTVSLTDLAGNTARGARTFTLRLSRR